MSGSHLHNRERQSLLPTGSPSSFQSGPHYPYDTINKPDHGEEEDEKMARRRHEQLPLSTLLFRYSKTILTRRSGFVNTIIIGFVFTGVVVVLVVNVLNRSTERALEGITEKARKRPAYADYKSYPVVESYYNGLFHLVNRTENVPQWPASDAPYTKPSPAIENLFPKSHLYDPADEYAPDRVACSFDDEEDGSGRKRETPVLRRYNGVPAGFPDSVFGSHELLGLDDNVCYDRFGRFGAYGYGYSEAEGGLGIGLPQLSMSGRKRMAKETEGGFFAGSMPLQKIDWRGVDWGKLQNRCIEKNKHRFWQPKDEDGDLIKPAKKMFGVPEYTNVEPTAEEMKGKKSRTAILVRTWHNYEYTKNDILNLRSLISETTMASGGEYEVHLLVHVKDNSIPIWADAAAYEEVVKTSVPEEFRGLVTLWNENLSKSVYSNLADDESHLSVHGVYRSTFMPIQLFSLHHPEYHYIYNWELDFRSTAHHLPLLSSLSTFSTKQPRLHLWERSSTYYIPALHGPYEGFAAMIRRQNPEPILGAIPVPGTEPIGPAVPTNLDELEQWGVGEDADLMTFSPFFDPANTNWGLKHLKTNYPSSVPHKTAIITHTRLSRRLLRQMHLTNSLESRTSFSETFPVSTALHHGLKAVYVPHPVYFDRVWKGAQDVDATFNAQEKDVYGRGEWVFGGASWYAGAKWAGQFYSRWWRGAEIEDRNGRMCLVPMMVHPVKDA